jgi:hypothetical protein
LVRVPAAAGVAQLPTQLSFAPGADSEASMAAARRKRKTFYASVQVTRVEEWCVEAETAEEARALLAGGGGERCQIGDCLYVEVENVSE